MLIQSVSALLLAYAHIGHGHSVNGASCTVTPFGPCVRAGVVCTCVYVCVILCARVILCAPLLLLKGLTLGDEGRGGVHMYGSERHRCFIVRMYAQFGFSSKMKMLV